MIDHEAFQEEMEIDREMVLDMYSLFREDLWELEKQLQAMELGDRNTLCSIAHGIRGIAITYKANDLAREAEAVERGMAESLHSDGQVETDGLKQRIAEVLDVLDKLLETA